MGKQDPIFDLPKQIRYKGAVISPIHTKQGLRWGVSHSMIAPLFPSSSEAKEHVAQRRRLQKLRLVESIYRPNQIVPVQYSHTARRGETQRKPALTVKRQLAKARQKYRVR